MSVPEDRAAFDKALRNARGGPMTESNNHSMAQRPVWTEIVLAADGQRSIRVHAVMQDDWDDLVSEYEAVRAELDTLRHRGGHLARDGCPSCGPDHDAFGPLPAMRCVRCGTGYWDDEPHA